MKRFFILLLFALQINFCFSQEVQPRFSKWSVTVRPMGIFDPFLPNFTFGVQHLVKDKTMVEFTAGLIQSWYCTYNGREEHIMKSGVKIGGEFKYLFHKKLYVSAQVFHNNYIKTDRESVWRFAQSYTEEYEVRKNITSTGGHVKFGVLVNPAGKRMFFDFYAGPGLRYRHIKYKNIPDDAEFIGRADWIGPDFIFNDRNGSLVYPSVSFGFSLGLKLGE